MRIARLVAERTNSEFDHLYIVVCTLADSARAGGMRHCQDTQALLNNALN
jgi:hypothetical protein